MAYANTLTGFYKQALENAGYKPRYFTRKFLLAYIDANKRRAENIANGVYIDYAAPDYEYRDIMRTDFYTKNGGAYCKFIELYAIYKNAFK